METFTALLVLCSRNSPVTRSFDVFFDLRWINVWVYNREAGELRRHRAHYDVIVICTRITLSSYNAVLKIDK